MSTQTSNTNLDGHLLKAVEIARILNVSKAFVYKLRELHNVESRISELERVLR